MEEWADVLLPRSAADDKGTLQSRALFFVPKAQDLQLDGRPLVIANLRAQASVVRSQEQRKPQKDRREIIGGNALTNIMKCQPVRYKSALMFIDFINTDVYTSGKEPQLKICDIVACVFKPINLPGIMSKLGFDTAKLSRDSAIDFAIVNTMTVEDWRHQLSDLLKVRNVLLESARLKEVAVEQLTDNPEEFITTFCKPSEKAAIATMQNGRYVYSQHNLVAAPPDGHPWARQG